MADELLKAVEALRNWHDEMVYIAGGYRCVIHDATDFIIVGSLTHEGRPDIDIYTKQGVLTAYRILQVLTVDEDDFSLTADIWEAARYIE